MDIGEMTRNNDGTVTGWIAEADFDFDYVSLEPVKSDDERAKSDGKKAPMFDIMTKSPRGRDVRLGSLWEEAARDTGLIYFRGYLDSASSGFVPIRLFGSRKVRNLWTVVRPSDRRKRRAAQQVMIAGHGDTPAPANETADEGEREAAYA